MQFLIGLGVGLLIMFVALFPPLRIARARRRAVGFLRVDRSDPSDGPYLFLELGTDVNTVINSKYVTFEVKVEDFVPHK